MKSLYRQGLVNSAGYLKEVASNSGNVLVIKVLPNVSLPVFLLNNLGLGYII